MATASATTARAAHVQLLAARAQATPMPTATASATTAQPIEVPVRATLTPMATAFATIEVRAHAAKGAAAFRTRVAAMVGAGATAACADSEARTVDMRASEDIEQAVEQHANAVWRVCTLYFRSHADAQDAFQDTFVKYALADETAFKGDEHKKAWLIRVSTNVCKDMLRAVARRNVPLDESGVADRAESKDASAQPVSFESEVIDAMRALDDPPRTPLYLTLYEGYSAVEVARMVDAPVNTVYSWIARGKKQLKEALA